MSNAADRDSDQFGINMSAECDLSLAGPILYETDGMQNKSCNCNFGRTAIRFNLQRGCDYMAQHVSTAHRAFYVCFVHIHVRLYAYVRIPLCAALCMFPRVVFVCVELSSCM